MIVLHVNSDIGVQGEGGLKCEYLKAAVEKCASLRIPSSEYILYLPELLPEDVDPAQPGLAGNG